MRRRSIFRAIDGSCLRPTCSIEIERYLPIFATFVREGAKLSTWRRDAQSSPVTRRLRKRLEARDGAVDHRAERWLPTVTLVRAFANGG